MARVGLDLVRSGISSGSVLQLLKQLGLEQTDPRQKAARPIMQVLPCFDLYWRLHRRVRPELSIFFTNHVATVMHRYWGDAMAATSQSIPTTSPTRPSPLCSGGPWTLATGSWRPSAPKWTAILP